MSAAELLLLMKPPEATFFRELLQRQNPALTCRHVTDADALARAAGEAPPGSRLIAFSTQVIVPPAVLIRMGYDAYNFHPGPPDYPGSKPSTFAVYEGARRFGVTLHRMVDRVDSGAIIATDRFDLTDGVLARDVAIEAYSRMARLAMSFAPELARLGRPLPPNGEVWRGRKRTLAQYEALRRIESGMSEDEVARRLRACDGIYSPLPAGDSAPPDAGPSRSLS